MNIVYEYRGFLYELPAINSCVEKYLLLFDNKPMIQFEDYNLLTNFVDNVINIVEQMPWFKDYKLHLTGCKRCERTANGKTFDPCETGKSKFVNAKNVTSHVCAELIDAIVADRRQGDSVPSLEENVTI